MYDIVGVAHGTIGFWSMLLGSQALMDVPWVFICVSSHRVVCHRCAVRHALQNLVLVVLGFRSFCHGRGQ